MIHYCVTLFVKNNGIIQTQNRMDAFFSRYEEIYMKKL